MTAQLDTSVRRNSGHFDAIVTALDASARDLNRTADQVASLSSDPQLRSNILQTTQGIAQTATTFSSIANDLRNVTGNPQTQAQLRDTVANVDAAAQKANSLLAQFGGRSSVYGVDRGATPSPGGTPLPNGTYPRRPGEPPAGSTPPPASVQGNIKNKVGSLVRDLLALQIRVSELDRQRAGANSSPLLTRDRGPQTDINVIALPKGDTYLFAGANDIGAKSSWNFAAMTQVRPGLSVGGGVLYSRLGARAVYSPALSRGLGLEARVYDLRRPTTDAYANFKLGNGLTIFGGERDLLRDGRRTTFGLQYQF